jgi:CheY-like chemotaxis protein
MPGLDGFALIERVRAHERKSALPAAHIILVTADVLEETGEKVKLFPGTLYLTKPIRKNQLIGAIQASGRE